MAATASPEGGCKRLHADSLQALKDERDSVLRLKDLQKRLKQLRREGNALQQAKDHKRSVTEAVLHKYARASCRELCEAVYNTFPREVRDMIYSHLHNRSEARITPGSNSWAGKGSYFLSSSEAEFLLCHDGNGNPPKNHLWDVEFVGAYMRRELSEHYYRSIRFHFDSNFELLPKFRVTDQWKLGFRPVDVVLNIAVTVNCDTFAFKGLEPIKVDNGWGTNNSGWDSVTERRSCDELVTSLEHLLGFRRGTKLSIELHVGGALKGGDLEAQAWMCDTVLPVILPTLHRLTSAGYHIRLVLAKPSWQNFKFVVDNQMLTLETWSLRFDEFKAKELRRMEQEEDDATPDEDLNNVSSDESEEDADGGEAGNDDDD